MTAAYLLYEGFMRTATTESIARILKNEVDIDIHAKNEYDETALILAARWNKNPEVITTLLEARAEVNAKNYYGETALMQAAKLNDNPEVIITLLKAGATINNKEKKEILQYILKGTNLFTLPQEKRERYDLIKNLPTQ